MIINFFDTGLTLLSILMTILKTNTLKSFGFIVIKCHYVEDMSLFILHEYIIINFYLYDYQFLLFFFIQKHHVTILIFTQKRKAILKLRCRCRTSHRKTTRGMQQLIESQLVESKTCGRAMLTKDNSGMSTTHRYKLKQKYICLTIFQFIVVILFSVTIWLREEAILHLFLSKGSYNGFIYHFSQANWQKTVDHGLKSICVHGKLSLKWKEPRYSIQCWSIYERVLAHDPRMTNFFKGQLRQFSCVIGVSHPDIYKILTSLKSEHARTEMIIYTLVRDEEPDGLRKK